MTRKQALEAKARAKAEDAKARHFDGPEETREHHMGCGHGTCVCPGEPDWSFARTDVPALADAYMEAMELILLPMMSEILTDPMAARFFDRRLIERARKLNDEYEGKGGK